MGLHLLVHMLKDHVSESYMAICIQKNIFRFEIPVHYANCMEMRNGRNNLRGVYPSQILSGQKNYNNWYAS